MASIREQILQAIAVKFPGCPILTPAQALQFTPGFEARDPENAAAQRITRGSFPFPLIKLGRRHAVLATDIAATLAQLAHAQEHEEPTRSRGRPRKLTGGAR